VADHWGGSVITRPLVLPPLTGAPALGALLPCREQPRGQQCVGYQPFAEPSASARFLRTAAVRVIVFGRLKSPTPDVAIRRLCAIPIDLFGAHDEDAREVGPGRPRLRCPPRGCGSERLAGLDEDCKAARGGLVAPNDHVDIERIELDASADAARRLGSDEGRTRAEERVDDDFAAVGDVVRRRSSARLRRYEAHDDPGVSDCRADAGTEACSAAP
jgi:hypothetical protein